MNVRSLVRKYLLYTAVVILSLLLLLFIFRDILLQSYLEKKIDRFNKDHHAILKIDRAYVEWLAAIRLTGISLRPENGDTLLKLDTVYISINGWKLLAGRVVLQDLELKSFLLSLVRKGSDNNFNFLLKNRDKPRLKDTVTSIDYSVAADRLTGFIFDKIPTWVNVSNFTLQGVINGHKVICHSKGFRIANHSFQIPLIISESDTVQQWIMEGMIDRYERSVRGKLAAINGHKIWVPFITHRLNAMAGFDSVSIRFFETKSSSGLVNISGAIAINGMSVHHERIAKQPVPVDKVAIDFSVNIGKDFAELDSSTLITFNKLMIHPFIRYRPKPFKQLTFRILKRSFPSMDLFSSLPEGLFANLTGIRTEGNLSFYLDFFVDLSMPDSLLLDAGLLRQDFRVVSFGNVDLTKINEPFPYTAYEKGEPVKTFMVGPDNPEFRPLDRISPYLKVSVLNSEDPSFFQHRGFIPDAFRESIITDIKEKKFARGGSTISMQLVKNVFLNRNKTIARKGEEALLVWLIENQQLSTKDRMFEVYLNIIEWGPLIYGAQEASKFYFNKDVARLTLGESIFLASIIPRPKWFKYCFDEFGNLRESQKGFFRLLSDKMLLKGQITQQDYDKLVPEIILKGEAKFLLKSPDSIQVEEESLIEN